MSIWLPDLSSFVQASVMFWEGTDFEDRVWRQDFLKPELQDSLPRAEVRFPLFTILPSTIAHGVDIA